MNWSDIDYTHDAPNIARQIDRLEPGDIPLEHVEKLWGVFAQAENVGGLRISRTSVKPCDWLLVRLFGRLLLVLMRPWCMEFHGVRTPLGPMSGRLVKDRTARRTIQDAYLEALKDARAAAPDFEGWTHTPGHNGGYLEDTRGRRVSYRGATK